jgi:hypothetical protein
MATRESESRAKNRATRHRPVSFNERSRLANTSGGRDSFERAIRSARAPLAQLDQRAPARESVAIRPWRTERSIILENAAQAAFGTALADSFNEKPPDYHRQHELSHRNLLAVHFDLALGRAKDDLGVRRHRTFCVRSRTAARLVLQDSRFTGSSISARCIRETIREAAGGRFSYRSTDGNSVFTRRVGGRLFRVGCGRRP